MSFDIKLDPVFKNSFLIVCSDCNWESHYTKYMDNALRYWEGHKNTHDHV
jgi:hypothetical protein